MIYGGYTINEFCTHFPGVFLTCVMWGCNEFRPNEGQNGIGEDLDCLGEWVGVGE